MQPTNRHGTLADALFETVTARLGYSVVDVEEKSVAQALSLVLSWTLTSQEEVNHFVHDLLLPFVESSQEERPMLAANGLRFLKGWLESGRHQDACWYRALRERIARMPPSPAQNECLIAIDLELQRRPNVVGKWPVAVDALGWTAWDASYIAQGLTAQCAYFFDLRPFEFNEERDGLCGTLTRLRSSSSAVSRHVVLSTLKAFQESEKRARQALTLWLEVAEALRALHNFHMLLAIHNGWHMHQLDRLNAWAEMPSSVLKRKAALDELCSVEDRFAGLLKEQSDIRKAREPGIIPCIFWFVQKAELLHETPVLTSDGKVNESYLQAARSVFGSLKEFQRLRYESIKDNEATYYFSQLASDQAQQNADDEYSDMLHALSDEIKSSRATLPKPKRLSLTSFFKSSSSRDSSIEKSGDEGSM